MDLRVKSFGLDLILRVLKSFRMVTLSFLWGKVRKNNGG